MIDTVYIQGLINNIDARITEEQERGRNSNFLHRAGSIAAGILGVVALLGQPMLGIAFFGAAAAIALNRHLNETNRQSTLNSLVDQRNHLTNVMWYGLDTSQNAMQSRQTKINNVRSIRENTRDELYSRAAGHTIGNVITAGGLLLAGAVSNPVVGAACLATIGLKYLLDRRYRKTHRIYERTENFYNNQIYDYNIGTRANSQANGGNSQQQNNQQGQNMGNQNTRQNNNGQPQQNNGQPQQNNGQPQQNNGQPQQNNGQPQQNNGQPQQNNGQPQQNNGQPQQNNGQPQQNNGQPQQNNGQPQQTAGNPYNQGGQPFYQGGQPYYQGGQPYYQGGQPYYNTGAYSVNNNPYNQRPYRSPFRRLMDSVRQRYESLTRSQCSANEAAIDEYLNNLASQNGASNNGPQMTRRR